MKKGFFYCTTILAIAAISTSSLANTKAYSKAKSISLDKTGYFGVQTANPKYLSNADCRRFAANTGSTSKTAFKPKALKISDTLRIKNMHCTDVNNVGGIISRTCTGTAYFTDKSGKTHTHPLRMQGVGLADDNFLTSAFNDGFCQGIARLKFHP